MNKVILQGRLTKDPEIKYTGSDNRASARFTIAVSRTFKNKNRMLEMAKAFDVFCKEHGLR
jgi:single-strand DNA-binding protein